MPAVEEEDATAGGQDSPLEIPNRKIADSKNSHVLEDIDAEVELCKRSCGTSDAGEVDASLLAHFDVLRFKNTFFEALEELRMKRAVNRETEERLLAVMAEKHELEQRLEDVLLKASTLTEHHAALELEGTKRYEEQMRSMEEEKNKLVVLNEGRERELKALKDEIRALHLNKYNLSKQAQEQERQLQLQCTSRETYVSLVNHLEEKCLLVTKRVTEVTEQIEKVEENVKEAVRLNNNLMLANRHQGCTLKRYQQDLEVCRRELQQARAQQSCSDSSGTVLGGGVAKMRSNEQELKMQIELNRQLQHQLSQLRDDHQNIIQSLRCAHELTERHAESCARLTASEANLQKELDSRKDELEALEKDLKASALMHSTLEGTFNQQRHHWEAQHVDISHRLVTLQAEYTTLEARCELLEMDKSNIAKELALRDSQVCSEVGEIQAILEGLQAEMDRDKRGVVKLEEDLVRLQSEVTRLDGELHIERREVTRLKGELEMERKENSVLKSLPKDFLPSPTPNNFPSDLPQKDLPSVPPSKETSPDPPQSVVMPAKEGCASGLIVEGRTVLQLESSKGLLQVPTGLNRPQSISDATSHGQFIPPHSTVSPPDELDISVGPPTRPVICRLPSLSVHLHKIQLPTASFTITSSCSPTSISASTVVSTTCPSAFTVNTSTNAALTCTSSSAEITYLSVQPQQCGDIAQPQQCGDIAQPQQCGDIAQPQQCGDIAQPQQCGDIAQPQQCGDIAQPQQCGDIAQPQQCGDPQSGLKNTFPIKPSLAPALYDASHTETIISLNPLSAVSTPLESSEVLVSELSLGVGAVVDPSHPNSFSHTCASQDGQCTYGADKEPLHPNTLILMAEAVKRSSSVVDSEEKFPSKKTKLDRPIILMARNSDSTLAAPAIPLADPVTSGGVKHTLSFPDDDDDDDDDNEATSYISKQIGIVASFLRVDRLRRPRRMDTKH